jgi:hypothetical protein
LREIASETLQPDQLDDFQSDLFHFASQLVGVMEDAVVHQ